MTAPSATWVRNRLLVGTLALFVVRALISLIRSGPVLVADEIGYLTDARVFVGGLAGQLHLAPFYRGGYSLLIAPVVGLVSDPGLAYHLILVVNAALTAAVFPLLYVLLSRILGAAPRIALPAAFVGALYPAVTVLSQVAMSCNVLFPLLCVWLIAWGGLLRAESSRAIGWAAAIGATTGALWAVHGRMATAVVLTAALLVWLWWRRRIDPVSALVALGALGAGIVATHFLDAFLIDHNYAGHARDEAADRLDALHDVGALRTVLANLVGQAWYLVVATFGLVLVVAGDALARLRLVRRGDGEGPPGVTLILLALTALLLAISAASFPERTRPDMLIYGRYVEVVAPPLVAIGVAILALGRVRARLARPLAGFALLSVALVLIRATASDPGAANRWNISSLPFLTFQLGPGVVVGASLVAAGGALALLWMARRRPAAIPVLAGSLLLAVVAYGVWNPVRSSERAAYPAGWTSPEAVAKTHGIETVAYDVDDYDVLGLYPLQWFLPDTEVLLFNGDRRRPPSRFILAAGSWNADHPRQPGRQLWRDVGRDQVLWELSGSPAPPGASTRP